MKSAIRDSVPAGKSSREVAATVTPQRRPPTMMGVATAARRPSSPTMAPNGPVASLSPLIRAGRPGAEGGRVNHPGLQPDPEADRYLVTDPAIGPDDGDMPLEFPALPGQVINAGDERRLGTDQAAQLIGDRAEHLGRPRPAGYQRGHPPQRGLLLRKLTQPCLAGWITARRRVGGMARVGAGIWRVHNADGSPAHGGPATLVTAARVPAQLSASSTPVGSLRAE